MYKINPLNPDTDMDGQNDKYDLIPLDYDMDGDGEINLAYLFCVYLLEFFQKF